MSEILITKANGETEPFDETKIRHSLLRSGIRKKLADATIHKLKPFLYSGISTAEIYRRIFNLLSHATQPGLGGRYSLKHALMLLGPSGYPFEGYISRVLIKHGYQTQINQIIPGRCVSHEIDILARNDRFNYLIECKYHNQPGNRTDLKVALYTQARFADIQNNPTLKIAFQQAWLITNTKFTSEAIAYGNCVGERLIGWDYPANASLRDLVEKAGLYPITCLSSLSQNQRQILLTQDLVLCSDLLSQPSALEQFKLAKLKQQTVLSEAKAILDS